MTTVTKTKFGPADHGVELSYDEFMAGDYEEGFKYELIDGRLFVSPATDLPENSLQTWLSARLTLFAHEHAKVINYVTSAARVFIPGRSKTTCPEPDIAAFSGFPFDVPVRERRWQEVQPTLVVEV